MRKPDRRGNGKHDHHDQTRSGDPGFNCSEFGLSGDPAAIDDQRCPGREFCTVGTEIENRRSDFLAGAHPSNRNHRGNLIARSTFSKTIEHIGGDHSRRDGVDADISFGEFEGDRFCQAFDSVFGSNVNADLSQTNMPGHTGIVDDGATSVVEHGRNFVTHRIENAPNVDVENAPILSFGSLIERAFPFNAGIVKSDVETAELIDGEIHRRFDVGIFGDVRADERRIAPEFFNFGDDLLAFFSRRPLRTTFAPARANSIAVVLPIPEYTPVTSATLPENVLLFILFSFIFDCGKSS